MAGVVFPGLEEEVMGAGVLVELRALYQKIMGGVITALAALAAFDGFDALAALAAFDALAALGWGFWRKKFEF
jgi:hypothetical protein